MQRLFIIVIVQVIIGEGFLLDFNRPVNFTCSLENLPCLDQNEWWGPNHLKGHQDSSIIPFEIEFDEEMIQDLRLRLKYHRPFIPPLDGVSFQYGFNTRILEDFVSYWAKEYPFKRREKFLNQFSMFKTNIQGLDIHFLWVKPKSAIRPGLGAGQAAVIMKNLMHRLGFKQFYVQGGDFGGITGMYLATIYPKEVLGFHTNWPFILHPTSRLMHVFGALHPPLVVDPALAYRMYPLYQQIMMFLRETGYLHEHASKSDTIGVPLSDSPAGLMAYNLEKFNYGLGTRQTEYDLHTVPRDSLIDNLMMYWAPNSITTAIRFYAETFIRRHYALGLDVLPCLVPTWTIQAENEATYTSPPLIRVKFPYLVNDTAIPYGGHFLAFETPKVFSDDVLLAIGAFRRIKRRGQEHPTNLQLQQDDWSINLPDFFKVLLNLYRHPEAWWIRGLLFFISDALTRIVNRFFRYSGLRTVVYNLLH